MVIENSRPTFIRNEAKYLQPLHSNLLNDFTGHNVNDVDYPENSFRALRGFLFVESTGNLTQIEGSPPTGPADGKPLVQGYLMVQEEDWYGITYYTAFITIFIVAKDNAGLLGASIVIDGTRFGIVMFESESIEYKGYSIGYDVFEADWGHTLWSGYDIKVNVTDVNGNWAKGEGYIKSVKDHIAEMLGPLWAVLKFIAELASMLIDWIWGVIEGIFNIVLKPYFDAMNDFTRTISNKISAITNMEGIVNILMEDIFSSHSFVTTNFAIVMAIMAVQNILGAVAFIFTGGAASVGGTIAKFITSKITSYLSTEITRVALSFSVGAIIGFLVTTLLPNLGWAFDVELLAGTTITSFLILFFQTIEYYKGPGMKTWPNKWFDDDMKALFFMFLSFGLLSLGEVIGKMNITINNNNIAPVLELTIKAVSLVVGVYLVIKAILNDNTWTDQLPFPIGFLDEMLSLGILGYDSASFGTDIGKLATGR